MVIPLTLRLAVAAVLIACSATVIAQRERGAWSAIARRVDAVGGFSNELVQPSMLVYDGSFKMPSGSSSWGYCTCALAYDPEGDSGNGSLFIGSYNFNLNWGGVAESNIPTPINTSNLAAMNTATLIQPDTDATEATLYLSRDASFASASSIIGLLIQDDTLFINAAPAYDGGASQTGSLYKRSKNLSLTGNVQGPFRTDQSPVGYTAGYLAAIPAAYQTALGGDMLTSLWSVSIVTRESSGQGAFAFHGADVGSTPAPTSTLLFYPPDHPMNRGFCGGGLGHPNCIEDGDVQLDYNPAFSGSEGLIVPADYRSFMFFGGMGTGQWCYGVGTSNLALDHTSAGGTDIYCYDPEEPAHGNHAYYIPGGGGGYKGYFWFFDINDLINVKNGAVTSYAPRPYAYGNIANYIPTYDALYAGKPGILGAAYDEENGRIFIAAQKQNGADPVIHVLHIQPPEPPPSCTESVSGFRIPDDGSSICDAGSHVWTFGAVTTPPNYEVLRDGESAAGGTGSEILWYNDVLYVFGSDSQWYLWNGTGYAVFGLTDPEGGGPPTDGHYVSTSGSDSNNCTASLDPMTPKRTLASAVTCLSAGETLWVRGSPTVTGIYDEGGIDDEIASGTSWVNSVKIAAYPGETVWVTPTAIYGPREFSFTAAGNKYIEFDGINVDIRAIYQSVLYVGPGVNFVRWRNSTWLGGEVETAISQVDGNSNEFINVTVTGGGVTGCTGSPTCNAYPFYLTGDDNVVDGCNLYGLTGSGVHIYSGSVTPERNIIKNNVIHDITKTNYGGQLWGIILSGDDNQAYNNVIYNLRHTASGGGTGIYILSGARNLIYFNTIYNNLQYGIRLQGDSGVSATMVQNNIGYQNGTNYEVGSNTGVTNSGVADPHNLFGTNPQFANIVGGNFRLGSTSSPAYNMGGAAPCLITSDADAITRPQATLCDIGAYEFH